MVWASIGVGVPLGVLTGGILAVIINHILITQPRTLIGIRSTRRALYFFLAVALGVGTGGEFTILKALNEWIKTFNLVPLWTALSFLFSYVIILYPQLRRGYRMSPPPKLTKEEKQVEKLLYDDDMEVADAAAAMGITPEELEVIHLRLLKKYFAAGRGKK
jgi:hypothetical protein